MSAPDRKYGWTPDIIFRVFTGDNLAEALLSERTQTNYSAPVKAESKTRCCCFYVQLDDEIYFVGLSIRLEVLFGWQNKGGGEKKTGGKYERRRNRRGSVGVKERWAGEGAGRRQSGGVHRSAVRSIFHHWRPTGYQDGAAAAAEAYKRKTWCSRWSAEQAQPPRMPCKNKYLNILRHS